MDELRILFVGDMTPFLTTVARRDALRGFGHEVDSIDQREFVRSRFDWLTRLTFWTLLTPEVFAFNRAILRRAASFRPDVVWIEKGVFVFPSTLRALHRRGPAALVYHNTDDWKAQFSLRQLHWRYLVRGLRDYDLHVTSNWHNAEEFRALGLPRVEHMELAANEAVRHPGPISDEERRSLGGPVGFIGHWEEMTERSLLHLVRHGIPLKVYGGHWDKAAAVHELGAALQHRLVWGDEYARAIASFDVNLGIVSKWNRSHTASRTFQIPALGAFLLHERNEVVTRYFREGVEAEFFGSDDELLEKCRHYLDHPDERRRIAEAGRRRCVESGYFETDRVRDLLPALDETVKTIRAEAT